MFYSSVLGVLLLEGNIHSVKTEDLFKVFAFRDSLEDWFLPGISVESSLIQQVF